MHDHHRLPDRAQVDDMNAFLHYTLIATMLPAESNASTSRLGRG